MTIPKNIRMYSILFLIALAVRLIYIVGFYGLNRITDSDSPEYYAYAVNLAEHGTYTDGVWTVFRAPGYPAYMAVVIKIFGNSLAKIQISQAFVSSCIPVLVFMIATLVDSNPSVALIAGIVSCFHFGLIDEPAHIISEATFTMLYALILLLSIKSADSSLASVATGAILALEWLTRPVAIILLPFISLWIILKSGLPTGIKRTTIICVVTAAIMMPWWLRNYRLHRAFIPSALQTGFVLKHTNYPHNAINAGALSAYDNLTEIQRDRLHMKDALEYIRQQPMMGQIIKKLVGTLYFFYPFLPAFDIFYVALLPFCVIGLYRSVILRNVNQWLLFSMFMYLPVCFVFNVSTRYRHSIMPAFIIVAASGLTSWHIQFKGRKWYQPLMTGWIGINLIVLAFAPQIRMLMKSILF